MQINDYFNLKLGVLENFSTEFFVCFQVLCAA